MDWVVDDIIFVISAMSRMLKSSSSPGSMRWRSRRRSESD